MSKKIKKTKTRLSTQLFDVDAELMDAAHAYVEESSDQNRESLRQLALDYAEIANAIDSASE